jgi:hypothetical protein
MPNEQEQFRSGAEIDIRPESEKIKDYKFEEVVASVNPVNWIEKTPDQWRKFPIFNQNGSGSCVAQTEAKEMGIMRYLKDGNYVHFSATDIYSQRSNKPASGMGAIDARTIVKNNGATLEVLTPSQGLTDQQMDTVVVEPHKREVGQVFAVPNFVELPAKNIDALASFIQTTKKGVMVWFYFEYREWTDHPVVMNPALDLYAGSTSRHSVTAVDFALVNGKKCIIIEDSWGPNFGLGGQRVIDEDFFNARNWYAGYLINFRFDDQTQPQPSPIPQPKPKYTFTKTLQFSPVFTVDADVKALQDILKYEGFFPANSQSTGYYGSISSKAVLAWQKKHKIAPNDELDKLQGRIVGPKTRAVLNQIYSQ